MTTPAAASTTSAGASADGKAAGPGAPVTLEGLSRSVGAVRALDGRVLTVAPPDGLTRRLSDLYEDLKDEEAVADRAQD